MLGKIVVWLKGGDLFVFGCGGEELDYFIECDVFVEVVFGIIVVLGCVIVVYVLLIY